VTKLPSHMLTAINKLREANWS